MKEINQALISLAEKLTPVTGNWMIIGTASLYLAGYPVKPNDIDILTDAITAKEIEHLLSRYKVESQVKPNEKFRSIFSQYNIHDFNVELMGELEVNTAGGWVILRSVVQKVIMAHLHGKSFKIPSHADQLRIYTLFNRAKDAPVLQLLRHK